MKKGYANGALLLGWNPHAAAKMNEIHMYRCEFIL